MHKYHRRAKPQPVSRKSKPLSETQRIASTPVKGKQTTRPTSTTSTITETTTQRKKPKDTQETKETKETESRTKISFHVWEWVESSAGAAKESKRYIPTGHVITSVNPTKAASKAAKMGYRVFVLLDHQSYIDSQQIHAIFYLAESKPVRISVKIGNKTPFLQRQKVVVQRWHQHTVHKTQILELLVRYRDPREVHGNTASQPT